MNPTEPGRAATPPDEVRRFILENQPVRGYWVSLAGAWQELRAHQEYSPPVRALLGEAVSASVLLAATLKFEGTLIFQLEGAGELRLLVAQCTHDFRVRAVARLNPEAEADRAAVGSGAATFRRLVGRNGRVIVTIEAAERDARYQGIVPLDGDSLAECLETYFASSEQLPTRVRLAADEGRSMGLLVQRLPGRSGEHDDLDSAASAAWSDARRSLESVTSPELLTLALPDLLARRFAARDVRFFSGAAVQFSCRCSPERVDGLLRSLGVDEVREVIREQGTIAVTCEFCQGPYRYDAVDVERVFSGTGPVTEPKSLH